MTTNNGAESYHGRLKSLIKCNKPRIWNFLAILDNIITDKDNEIARLQRGLSITRGQKKKSILNQERRLKCKEKLVEGLCYPFQFIKAISFTVGSFSYTWLGNYSSDEEDESTNTTELSDVISTNNKCVVCLGSRQTTWIFMPCKHATCCGDCCKTIEELEQPCPVCRAVIACALKIFT